MDLFIHIFQNSMLATFENPLKLAKIAVKFLFEIIIKGTSGQVNIKDKLLDIFFFDSPILINLLDDFLMNIFSRLF